MVESRQSHPTILIRRPAPAGALERIVAAALRHEFARLGLLARDDGTPDCICRFADDQAGEPPGDAPRRFTFALGSTAPSLTRFLDRPGDRIIAASRWSRDRLVEAGVATDAITIVPLGVDPRRFMPLSAAERAASRARLGVRDDEVLLFGRPGPDHRAAGLDLLFRAFSRLRRRGLPVRLMLHEDAGSDPPDFCPSLRQAAAAEPGGLTASALDAVIVLPDPVARDHLRLLHGAADGFVSPYRSIAFDLPALEAIATGCPVVVTEGGPTDDVCCDDVAWRVPALRHGSGARAWLEADLDHLTEALAALVQQTAFDHRRFARARLQHVRTFSWARAAATVATLAGAEMQAAPPAPLPGLAVRAARPPVTPPAPAIHLPIHRPIDRRRPGGADPRCLSIVVQGPCARQDSATTPAIDTCLASIRRSFPGAQLIVATWQGSDIDGLDADDIVLCQDPGALTHTVQAPCNINRMLTSTANGLAAATRPLCIKTRSDVMFRAGTLASRDLWPASPPLTLERRIWTTSLGTWRLVDYLRPFHVGDMVQYGTTEDLQRLWDIPQQSWQDIFLPDPAAGLPRLCPEQALLTGYLRQTGRPIDLDITCDGRWEVLLASLDLTLGGFDVLDEITDGIVFPQRLAVVRQLVPPETPESFARLRHAFQTDRDGTMRQVFSRFHETLRQKLARRPGAGPPSEAAA